MNTTAIRHTEFRQDILFRSAMERIRDLEAEIQKLRQGSAQSNQFIRIHQSNRIISAAVSEIVYIRAEDNYSRIFLKNGNQYYVSRTLKSWMEELKGHDFLRCHRSFFVRREEIAEVNRRSHELILRDGSHIAISRRFQKSCLSSIFPERVNSTSHKLNTIIHKLIKDPISPHG